METSYDLVIIGGGAAGLMSAAVASKNNLRVLLLEKNEILGKKLRITGGGRCNITNHTTDPHSLLPCYGEAESYLYSAFSKFGVTDTLEYFHQLNLPTKLEAENRVFPKSEKAEDVAEALIAEIIKNQATIKTGIVVKKILTDGDKITGVRTSGGVFTGTRYILATGGTSRPETGSTGDGYTWLRELGYNIITPLPSLVPIEVKDDFIESLAGLSLVDTNIGLYQNGIQFSKTKGKVLFTHQGLSGPGILNQSQLIGEALNQDPVEVKINLVPNLSEEEIQTFFRDLPLLSPNKQIKNSLAVLMPERLVEPVLKIAHIDGNKKANSITRAERHTLTLIIRAFPLQVKKLLGTDKAIIASGGLDLKEVDFKTMKATKHQNLQVVGDLLNINRPSGGYSLQLCWTTGYIAGISK
jgi:predicted Rossmann fold flavoprotein